MRPGIEWEVYAGGRLHKVRAWEARIEREGVLVFYDADSHIQKAFREWGRLSRLT